MDSVRAYGAAPYRVAVIHGGPGAPGSVAPVARELAREYGVLEPLQTADSLDGQVEELRAVLEEYATLPVTLIGSSWGAMLAFIVAGRYPALVRKLILVGSGVYREEYAAHIDDVRMARLSEADKQRIAALDARLADPTEQDRNGIMAQLGELFTRSDTYDPITLESELVEAQFEINQRVWADAVQFRRSGELLALGHNITCPVVAIHGDYDPHPPEGIRDVLAPVLKDFRFILLAHCGHEPWRERQARDAFFALLRQELA